MEAPKDLIKVLKLINVIKNIQKMKRLDTTIKE